MWPISIIDMSKKKTQPVLKQIKIGFVISFAFTKETFLPKELQK